MGLEVGSDANSTTSGGLQGYPPIDRVDRSPISTFPAIASIAVVHIQYSEWLVILGSAFHDLPQLDHRSRLSVQQLNPISHYECQN